MTRPCTAVKTWNFFRNEQELGTKGLLKDDLFRLIRFVRLPYHSSKRAVVGGALNFAHVLLGLSLLVGRVELLVVLGWKWRKTSNMCRKVGCRCFCSFVGRPKVQTVKLVHQPKKNSTPFCGRKVDRQLNPIQFQQKYRAILGSPLGTFQKFTPWKSAMRFHIFDDRSVAFPVACFRAKKIQDQTCVWKKMSLISDMGLEQYSP